MAYPHKTLIAIEEMARREYLPIIGQEKGRFLGDLLEQVKPCRPLEVGSLIGYTTAIIAASLDNGCRMVTVEINSALADRTVTTMAAAGLDDRVKVIRGDAREVIPSLGGGFDFVFLDSLKSQYLGLLKILEPKLAKQAVVVANGTGLYSKEVAPYLEYLHHSERWHSRSQSFGDDAMEISQLVE